MIVADELKHAGFEYVSMDDPWPGQFVPLQLLPDVYEGAAADRVAAARVDARRYNSWSAGFGSALSAAVSPRIRYGAVSSTCIVEYAEPLKR